MPSSSKEGKDIIVNWVAEQSNISKILDIGAGKGTYKNLFSKRKIVINAHWTAVEVWLPYIENYQLSSIYNKVINEDARLCDYKKIGPVDLTIMGDVLEHVTKDEAIELVSTIMSISKFAIISIPIIHYPQDAEFGNPYEVHVKDDWSHDEVMSTFREYIKKYQTGTEIGVYWLEA